MAKPAKPVAAKKEVAAVADAPKSNKKLIIIGAVVALAIAGAGGWYFMKSKSAEHEEVKVEAHKDPIFIALDTFTVNLQREEADQFLQINITLKVFEPELGEKIKAVLPEIRSKLNLLLSSKRPSELAQAEGKKKLATEIALEANNVLGIHNAPVAHVPAPAPAAPVVEPAAAPAAEHEKQADVVAASAPAAEAGAGGEAASAPVAAAPVHVEHVESATSEKKGVVDVLFTSFIIQ